MEVPSPEQNAVPYSHILDSLKEDMGIYQQMLDNLSLSDDETMLTSGLLNNPTRQVEEIPGTDVPQLNFASSEAFGSANAECLAGRDFSRWVSTAELLSWSRSAVDCMKLEAKEVVEEECSLCMKPMEVVRVAPCGHSFHGVCLFKWLAGSEVGSVPRACPICKRKLWSDIVESESVVEDS